MNEMTDKEISNQLGQREKAMSVNRMLKMKMEAGKSRCYGNMAKVFYTGLGKQSEHCEPGDEMIMMNKMSDADINDDADDAIGRGSLRDST